MNPSQPIECGAKPPDVHSPSNDDRLRADPDDWGPGDRCSTALFGKSHLASAIGLALVENGYRVLFTRTTDLVQRMQVARRELALEALLARLDRYHLLILDDIAYVQKDQAETSVLFELISARYERRSLLITANQPFGEWNRVFPDETTAVAAVDRLVHHATILEMNVESYRRREALDNRGKRKRGRPASFATGKNTRD